MRLYQTKNLQHSERNHQKKKKKTPKDNQPDRRRCFQTTVLTRGSYPKYIKILYNSTSNKQTNNLIKTQAEDLNGHSSQEDMQMTNKYMKGCSISLAIRELQVKSIMRYPLNNLLEWLLSTRQVIITSVGEVVDTKRIIIHCWWAGGSSKN